jgi:acetyltransferase-like isoleucine patch superfamily enzyme
MKYIILLCNLVMKYARVILDGFLYPLVYYNYPGLELGEYVKFKGKPLIDTQGGGYIKIGSNSQIFSRNHDTHVNYGVPSKLVADRRGARIIIGDNCSIGGACIHAWNSITIGNDCLIGTGTNIIDANGHPVHLDNCTSRRPRSQVSHPIIIEDDVWIALNCIILPGTNIGYGSVIGSNSVVKGHIPPMSLVMGNPAQVVGKIRGQIQQRDSSASQTDDPLR